MSEKIYACLLRLFPRRFREAYGEEALLLFRDRIRDERGFFPALRLWLDLLLDLVISIPHEYRYVRPELMGVSEPVRSDGMPSLHVLEATPLRTTTLLFGGMLSLATLSVIPALISSFGTSRPPRASVLEPQLQDVNSVLIPPISEVVQLDATERRRVIDAVIKNLKEHYTDPAIAEMMAQALLAHEKAGDYDALTDGAAFAALLTRQLRDVSHDMHLEVVYSQMPLPSRTTGPNPERSARYREAMQEDNCTFEEVEMLPHQIAYLKLNSFPDPSVCGSTAKAAMARLNGADAIIFDLRDNRGGYPGMVMLLAAYFFDHPEYFYNPRENTTEQSWTRSPVPGNRLAHKPVYVLTSARTFSGAEHFSYNLKMLKRATLVGETTAGATDVGTFHRIDDHFGMGIRETRPINPYSEPDWAAVGVQPDVKVKAADALETAERLAQDSLKSK
jgi:Peptidase family S41/N-terminal domain of Peptidase_S41 in eukaryotic IRBP